MVNHNNFFNIEEKLNREGFAKVKNLFSTKQKYIIKKEVENIFKKKITYSPDKEWSFRLTKNKIGKIQTTAIGHSEALDNVLLELFDNEDFNDLIDDLVGKNRKLVTLNIRKADAETQYDGMHTDHPGMISFSILANNHYTDSPCTFVVPKSHKFLLALKDKIESLPVMFFYFLYKKLLGNVGDCYIFYNRSWHGMAPGKNKGICIIIAFIAEGYEVTNNLEQPEYTNYGLSFKNKRFKTLNNLLDKNHNIKNKLIERNYDKIIKIDEIKKMPHLLDFVFIPFLLLPIIKKLIKLILNR